MQTGGWFPSMTKGWGSGKRSGSKGSADIPEPRAAEPHEKNDNKKLGGKQARVSATEKLTNEHSESHKKTPRHGSSSESSVQNSEAKHGTKQQHRSSSSTERSKTHGTKQQHRSSSSTERSKTEAGKTRNQHKTPQSSMVNPEISEKLNEFKSIFENMLKEGLSNSELNKSNEFLVEKFKDVITNLKKTYGDGAATAFYKEVQILLNKNARNTEGLLRSYVETLISNINTIYKFRMRASRKAP